MSHKWIGIAVAVCVARPSGGSAHAEVASAAKRAEAQRALADALKDPSSGLNKLNEKLEPDKVTMTVDFSALELAGNVSSPSTAVSYCMGVAEALDGLVGSTSSTNLGAVYTPMVKAKIRRIVCSFDGTHAPYAPGGGVGMDGHQQDVEQAKDVTIVGDTITYHVNAYHANVGVMVNNAISAQLPTAHTEADKPRGSDFSGFWRGPALGGGPVGLVMSQSGDRVLAGLSYDAGKGFSTGNQVIKNTVKFSIDNPGWDREEYNCSATLNGDQLAVTCEARPGASRTAIKQFDTSPARFTLTRGSSATHSPGRH